MPKITGGEIPALISLSQGFSTGMILDTWLKYYTNHFMLTIPFVPDEVIVQGMVFVCQLLISVNVIEGGQENHVQLP